MSSAPTVFAGAVFVDTAAWVALLNTTDALHDPARTIMAQLQSENVPLLTTEFVLLEVADALSAPHLRMNTVAFIERVRQLPIVQIVPTHMDLLSAAWQLYRQRPDKDWGLTDCTSFVIMQQRRIMQAFTSDRHFEQAGFLILL